ncbi:LAMI_0F09252g1_1 [Lachancea mirantina]|uniref:Phosphatidylserine decarboxylase proenzyme 2 n=1 Tax=Lachancea mirantina TaxID=1230905 RepID=A0A1G4K114_9SACH|nr:LAMI_0F09252g1_1 [Lachancea mirantina]
MGLIRRKVKKPRLELKVHVVQARNVTIEKSGCNPICLVASNGVFSKTSKAKDTASPVWHQELKLKLPSRANSGNVRIVIYDVLASPAAGPGASSDGDFESRKYLYLGEVQLPLVELFRKKDAPTSYRFTKEAAWYRLYNKNALQFAHVDLAKAPLAYSVGEIQVGFSMVCSKGFSVFKVFNEWQTSTLEASHHARLLRNPGDASMAAAGYLNSPASLANSGDKSDSSDEFPEGVDLEDLIENAGVNADADLDGDANEAADEFADTRSNFNLSSTDSELEDLSDIELTKMATALDEYEIVGTSSSSGFFAGSLDGSSPTADSESSSAEDEVHSDGLESDYRQMVSQKKRRVRPSRRRAHKRSDFELSKRGHAMGVVFVDINQITSLPRLKNRFSKQYCMDPFVIISFGRRVFKTSWRKNTLSPRYDERLAFEVFPHEINFRFNFKVVDRDSFSYHDDVADGSLTWSQLEQALGMDGLDGGSDWSSVDIPLTLEDNSLSVEHTPVLHTTFKFISYKTLKKQFWQKALNHITPRDSFDFTELCILMERLGTFSGGEIADIFYHFGRSPWAHEVVSRDELVEYLQVSKKFGDFRKVSRCPLCFHRYKKSRNAVNSKLALENDLITHFAICSSKDKNKKLIKPAFVSSDFASKRWFSRVLIKLTLGKYALGSNNANILVQDRDTGIVLEEKISAHVKFGMRIIYNSKGTESKKFKTLLRNLSIKQGRKFDSPASVKQIESFIKFHSLDMSECEETEYGTFNEFFYRKLKPGSRNPEADGDHYLLSPADSRCAVFASIASSREIWIKGRSFTVTKLTGGLHPEMFNDRSCILGVFRLAPQDYHRFHCPCDAVVGEPLYIDGEYYTVNPMAVRSELDVFGENVRMVIPLHTKNLGTILFIPIGAMMVGSIVLTVKAGQKVSAGDELGYFKFGGSTIVLVASSQQVVFDTDLLNNSKERIETLVKVGMSVGHSPIVREHKRKHVEVRDKAQLDRIKRTISISEDVAESMGNVTWEYQELQRFANFENTPQPSPPLTSTALQDQMDSLSI